jgi:hypothetical protein
MGVLAPAQITGWVRSNMVVPPLLRSSRVYRPGRGRPAPGQPGAAAAWSPISWVSAV